MAVLHSSQPNPQRKWKKRKMYAIKQIKICAEYRDMLPRPRLDLSGTPGLRPIGLSPGSWQTSLGLGSMSRYSAQILICITQQKWSFEIINPMIYQWMAYPRTREVASQATKSIRCPRTAQAFMHLLINPGLYLTYNWGYFAEMWNKSHWILQRIYRLTVCNRRAFALSRRCRVSRSRPRVFRETITVISLWRHNSGPWDNAESIAAHSNAIPRTMGCITK